MREMEEKDFLSLLNIFFVDFGLFQDDFILFLFENIVGFVSDLNFDGLVELRKNIIRSRLVCYFYAVNSCFLEKLKEGNTQSTFDFF